MIGTLQTGLGTLLIVGGVIFMLLGSIGLVRLPDFFSRTHAASKIDTVGIVLVLIGIAVMEGVSLNSGKLLVAVSFLMLTNPVSVHALARAALRGGYKPWRRGQAETQARPKP